jgi:hypothetical protein
MQTLTKGQRPLPQPEDVDDGSNPRRRQLEERAAALGRTCAARQREALRAEGRRIAGGWPGTVREMRARVAELFPTKAVNAFTEAEREIATRMAYASACRDWTKHALRDEA